MHCVLKENRTHFKVNILTANRKTPKACLLKLHNLDEDLTENLGKLNTVRSISVKYHDSVICGLKIVNVRGENVLDIDLSPGLGVW